jgi:hypothetical protein
MSCNTLYIGLIRNLQAGNTYFNKTAKEAFIGFCEEAAMVAGGRKKGTDRRELQYCSLHSSYRTVKLPYTTRLWGGVSYRREDMDMRCKMRHTYTPINNRYRSVGREHLFLDMSGKTVLVTPSALLYPHNGGRREQNMSGKTVLVTPSALLYPHNGGRREQN